MKNNEFYIQRNIYGDAFDLYWAQDDRRLVVTSVAVTVEKHIEGEISPVAMRFSRDDAQQLINELWRAGLRPENGEGTHAAVENIKAHLEDMRALVFKIDPRGK